MLFAVARHLLYNIPRVISTVDSAFALGAVRGVRKEDDTMKYFCTLMIIFSSSVFLSGCEGGSAGMDDVGDDADSAPDSAEADIHEAGDADLQDDGEPGVDCGEECDAYIVPTSIPYHTTRKLLVWSGTLLSGLSQKTDYLDETKLPGYYDLMAQYVNAERNFAVYLDDDTGYRPWNGDDLTSINEEYYATLDRRMTLVKERDLTEIVTIGPYAGYDLRGLPAFGTYVGNFVERTEKWLPNIIYETWNEPPNEPEWQKFIVDILLENGVPQENIQLAYADSSDWYAILSEDLGGKGLACYHWTGSMEAINAPWPAGWSTSSGMMQLMTLGLYGSDDGGDGYGQGLYWEFQRNIPGCDEGCLQQYRRPSNQQIYEVTTWMLQNGKGFEHLSAAGFQKPDAFPIDIEGAMNLGKTEMEMMRRAYDEVVGS
jgi:hypothetical protein